MSTDPTLAPMRVDELLRHFVDTAHRQRNAGGPVMVTMTLTVEGAEWLMLEIDAAKKDNDNLRLTCREINAENARLRQTNIALSEGVTKMEGERTASIGDNNDLRREVARLAEATRTGREEMREAAARALAQGEHDTLNVSRESAARCIRALPLEASPLRTALEAARAKVAILESALASAKREREEITADFGKAIEQHDAEATLRGCAELKVADLTQEREVLCLDVARLAHERVREEERAESFAAKWRQEHTNRLSLEADVSAALKALRDQENATVLLQARCDAAETERNDLRMAMGVLGAKATALQDRAEAVETRAEHLEKFKAYTHRRLDEMGVPADPDPERNARTGCRLECRFDWLETQLSRVDACVADVVAGLHDADQQAPVGEARQPAVERALVLLRDARRPRRS